MREPSWCRKPARRRYLNERWVGETTAGAMPVVCPLFPLKVNRSLIGGSVALVGGRWILAAKCGWIKPGRFTVVSFVIVLYLTPTLWHLLISLAANSPSGEDKQHVALRARHGSHAHPSRGRETRTSRGSRARPGALRGTCISVLTRLYIQVVQVPCPLDIVSFFPGG